MKLVSWNVNGLRSVYTKGFSDFLAEQSADLVCLQESKVVLGQLSEPQISPPGYSLVLNSAKRKGYSGVAIYFKNGLSPTASIGTGLGNSSFDEEGRYLITKFKDFTLYNIYFPSGSSGEQRQLFKYDFLAHLLEHFKQMPKTQRDRCIVCGDFNICHREIDIHHPKIAQKRELSGFLPAERAWMDNFTELGFIDSFRQINGELKDKYSWWSYRANSRQKNLGWRIDYIFLGQGLLGSLKNAEIHEQVLGSDHCPVSIELKFT